MKKKLIFFGIAAIFGLVLAMGLGGDIPGQKVENNSFGGATSAINVSRTMGQSFTIGVTGVNQTFTLTGVSLNLSEDAGDPQILELTIRNTNASGAPTDIIATNNTFNISSIGAAQVSVNVSMPGITLSKGVTYAIVARIDGTETDDSMFVTRSTDTYPGGDLYLNTTGVWSIFALDMTFIVYGTAEDISTAINDPPDGNITTLSSIDFNATITPTNITLTNATIYLYNRTGDLFNRTTGIVTGVVVNDSIITVATLPLGNNTWNVLGCGNNDSGSALCAFATNNFTFFLGAINSSSIFNSTVTETATELFREEVTIPDGSTISSAALIYNGTAKTGTVTLLSGRNFSLTNSFNIPLVNGSTQKFNWNITFSDGFVQNLGSNTQTVSFANLSLCSGANNVPFMNISYKNETTDKENVNATVPSSTWQYHLGTGIPNRTLSFSTSTQAGQHRFCFSPADETVTTNLRYDYTNTYSQQRTFQPSTLTLTNATTNQTLFLLPTNDGIFVTFQVVNAAGQGISGATITLSRSGFGDISQTITGASGTSTIFLNPNVVYTLTVSASGFTTFTATQTFPTTEFTITLGGVVTATDDFLRGIIINIRPKIGVLQNNTNFDFNMTINSSFWNMDEFGFTLYNSTKDTIGRNTSTAATGGFVSIRNNTGDNRLITMEYYWVINSSYNNRTASWAINPSSSGSIKGFFDRLNTYLDDGIFGIDTFGISFFVFIVIFITAGVLSFKFGLQSPIAIMGAVTLFVIFFQVVGILPSDTFGIPFFASILMVLILFLVIFRGDR